MKAVVKDHELEATLSVRSVLLHLLRAGLTGLTGGIVIPKQLNWQILIEEADRQSVAVLASDGLQELYNNGSYRAYDDKSTRRIKAQWFGKTLRYEQRYHEQLNTANKMANWLSSSGIQTVVMKGVTVAECYPIPSHRYSSDFDCFLVKDGEHFHAWEEGNRVIEKNGIIVGRAFYKNSDFNIDGLYVENHKFCTPCRGHKDLIKVEQRLQEIIMAERLSPIENTRLFKPPLMFSALFLTEHAFYHFLHDGILLKHVIDWALFRRKYLNSVDWNQFDKYCDDFGFTRFVETLDHLGEYIMGTRTETDLTSVDRRTLDSIWTGPIGRHNLDPHTLRAKLGFAGNTIRSAWKYRVFSNVSMLRTLWIQVKGFLFIKNPVLS